MMKRSTCNRILGLAILVLAFSLTSAAQSGYQGGIPWQVGDVVVCFGSGTCNVLRITGTGPVLLDQFSDSGSVSVSGYTFGTAINNNLHLFATDSGTGGSSNIVEYTIASVNQYSGLATAHTPLHVFNGSTGTGSEGIVGLALDAQGNMFLANSSPNTIVELNQAGTAALGSYAPSTQTPAWQAGTQYFTLGTAILDPNGHVQKVATAGKSGSLYPPFNQYGGTALDNAVVWQDLGLFAWQSKTAYFVTNQVVDPSFHLQQVTVAGTSGTKQPKWNDAGGTTKDGSVTWTDKGLIAWKASNTYSTLGQLVADGTAVPSFHLQKVVTTGVSGPSAPSWNDAKGQTTDGLTWADNGLGTGQNCFENQVASLDLSAGAGAVYFSAGPGGVVQTVTTPLSGTSSCTVLADFGPNVTLHGIRVLPPNSMPQNCGNASCPNANGGILVVATGSQFVDTDGNLPGVHGNGTGNATEFSSGNEIVDVCTGKPLPAAPAPPGPAAPSDSCALLLDAGSGKVVASYPVSNTNLEAVALDPLVSDCSSGNCTSSVPPPAASNFWVGDSATANIYKIDFATGTPVSYSANLQCTNCAPVTGVQGIGIYAGEGANQSVNAPLTRLFAGVINQASNTQEVFFPLPNSATDTNSLTVTGNNLPAGDTPLSLYASLIAAGTGANDQGLACRATTTNPNACIVWKVDANLPAISGAIITEKFAAPTTLNPPLGIDSSTDVFVDEAFDTTTSVGNFDPTGYKTSVHSLHEITVNGTEKDAGCTYGGNLNNRCFQNPNNITFKFTCSDPNFQGAALQNYDGGKPNLLIVEAPFPLPPSAPAAQPICQNTASSSSSLTSSCVLSGTGGTTNWRFDSTANQFVFNWNVNGTTGQGTYRACTFDPNQVQTPFCVNFSVAGSASCP